MRMAVALLSRLTRSPALRRRGRAAKTAWKQLFFWPLHAQRKSRFGVLGLAPGAQLPVAQLQLDAACACRACANFVPLTYQAIRGLTRIGTGPPRPRRWSPTAAVIDLDRLATFDDWRVPVSQRTSGKYHRSANKARRMGYASRVVGKDSYSRSLYELTGSKFRRSKGVLVWAAVAPPENGKHLMLGLSVGNHAGKFIYVTMLTCIALLCGSAQLSGSFGRLGEFPEEPADDDHGHAHHDHGHGHDDAHGGHDHGHDVAHAH